MSRTSSRAKPHATLATCWAQPGSNNNQGSAVASWHCHNPPSEFDKGPRKLQSDHQTCGPTQKMLSEEQPCSDRTFLFPSHPFGGYYFLSWIISYFVLLYYGCISHDPCIQYATHLIFSHYCCWFLNTATLQKATEGWLLSHWLCTGLDPSSHCIPSWAFCLQLGSSKFIPS